MMRYGFTTGSCAAAAAKACAYMLLTGKEKRKIEIQTPKGIPFVAELLDIKRGEKSVSCAVRKEGGDDPDITSGALIYAEVAIFQDKSHSTVAKEGGEETRIFIEGGVGVGRVTKPGLDQPIGSAAINRVPRKMIEKEVLEICRLVDYQGDLTIIISVPQGEELAAQTFNPKLGILGGISILGSSGIVEPMSHQALLDTIQVELQQKKAQGRQIIVISPGNYGQEYMKRTYNYDLEQSVKCSNFIGETVDKVVALGFKQMLIIGHIGKLVKVAGGIMNTHSKEGDCRMPLIAAAAIKHRVPYEEVATIIDCVTTEEAMNILTKSGKREAVMQTLLEEMLFYLHKRAGHQLQIEIILYANKFGELAATQKAHLLLKALKEEEVVYKV